MRFVLLVILTLALCPLSAMADETSLSGQLLPAVDEASADVVVTMTTTDSCAEQHSQIVRSKHPEWNDAVIEALSQWCFRPMINDDKFVTSTQLKYFVFDTTTVDVVPSLSRSASAVLIPAGRPLPNGIDDDREILFRDADADMRDPIANEIWLRSNDENDIAADTPLAYWDAMIDANGEVIAAHPVDASSPGAKQRLLQALPTLFSTGTRFKPGWYQDQPAPGIVRVAFRFYREPSPRGLQLPEFPRELQGLDGRVVITYMTDKSGRVHDIKVLGASHPKFEDSVISAFAAARFKPAILQGQPIATRSSLIVRYVTPGGGRQPYRLSGRGRTAEGLPAGLQYDTPPQVTMAVDPIYPFELANEGQSGSAKVDVLVGSDGKVLDVAITEASEPAFGLALKAAMEQWTFDPARKDGKPTEALFHDEQKFSTSAFVTDSLDWSSRRIVRELDAKGRDIVETAALDKKLTPLNQVAPIYPRRQLEASIGDAVVVDFYVDRDGFVRLPHATEFHDEALAWSAATAVSRWRFEKPLHNGKPIDVHARVKLRFDPPASEPADGSATAP